MRTRSLLGAAALAAVLASTAACGGSSDTPASPTAGPLPLAAESASFRYYYAPG